jgi:hypothetical protein
MTVPHPLLLARAIFALITSLQLTGISGGEYPALLKIA